MTHHLEDSTISRAIHVVDLAPLDPILQKYKNRRRAALLPMLHVAQSMYGWQPREVQEEVGSTLRVPLADIHGVDEFYTIV